MAYIYPLNHSGGDHLTVFDFTHLSFRIEVSCLKKCLDDFLLAYDSTDRGGHVEAFVFKIV